MQSEIVLKHLTLVKWVRNGSHCVVGIASMAGTVSMVGTVSMIGTVFIVDTQQSYVMFNPLSTW